jgi:glucose uptake protein GlcU
VNVSSGRRLERLLFGLLLAGVLVLSSRGSSERAKGLIQMVLWTFGVFVQFSVELNESLKKARPFLVALLLLAVHLVVIYSFRDSFPFHSGLTVIFGILAETLLVIVIYIRVCQSLDPRGPFGMTAAEREARNYRLPRL